MVLSPIVSQHKVKSDKVVRSKAYRIELGVGVLQKITFCPVPPPSRQESVKLLVSILMLLIALLVASCKLVHITSHWTEAGHRSPQLALN